MVRTKLELPRDLARPVRTSKGDDKKLSSRDLERNEEEPRRARTSGRPQQLAAVREQAWCPYAPIGAWLYLPPRPNGVAVAQRKGRPGPGGQARRQPPRASARARGGVARSPAGRLLAPSWLPPVGIGELLGEEKEEN